MTSLSHKNKPRIWGYAKRNKRCIPKEGMPHALTCLKIKDAYPKKVCHMPTRHVKKKEGEKKKRREKNSPYPKKKKQERDDFIQRSSSTTDQKYTSIHTLAHLDQGLWLVSPLDLVFDLAKYEKQVCLFTLHTYSSTKRSLSRRMEKKGTKIGLGEE